MDRRSFLKTLVAAAQIASQPGKALGALAAAAEQSPLLAKLEEISLEMEVEYYVHEEIKHRVLGGADALPFTIPEGFTTCDTARKRITENRDFNGFTGPLTPHTQNRLQHYTTTRKTRKLELYRECLSLLKQLKDHGITTLESSPITSSHSPVDEDITMVEATLRMIEKDTFWPDLLKIASRPSAASIRAFIRQHYPHAYANEEFDMLKSMSRRFGLELNHLGMDATEQAAQRQDNLREAQENIEYDAGHHQLQVHFLEGTPDSEVEGAVRITSDGPLMHNLETSLHHTLGEQAARKKLSFNREENSITIIDPPAEVMEMVAAPERRTRENFVSRLGAGIIEDIKR